MCVCPLVNVCVCVYAVQVLIGTSEGTVYEAVVGKSCTALVQGHGQGELWGVDVHPTKLVVATASDDKTARLWDMKCRQR